MSGLHLPKSRSFTPRLILKAALIPAFAMALMGANCGDPGLSNRSVSPDMCHFPVMVRPPALSPSADVSSQLDLQVSVHCEDGAPPFDAISGDTITWTVEAGGGTVSEDTTLTDVHGDAKITWTLSPHPTFQSVIVRGPRGTADTFHTIAIGRLAISSGDHQSGPAGLKLFDSIEVVYRDGNNMPVAGQPVEWVVQTGGGTLSPPASNTDIAGKAYTFWTLGPTAATHTATAIVDQALGGPRVTFTATRNTGGPTSCLTVPGTNEPATITSSTTWTKAASPHRFSGNVSVRNGAVLTIEEGAQVCSTQGQLRINEDNSGAQLLAVGTARAPIQFFAADPNNFWGGIVINPSDLPAPTSQLAYAEIDHAYRPVSAGNSVIMDHLLVTNYEGPIGIEAINEGALTNTTVSGYAGAPTTQSYGIYLLNVGPTYLFHHVKVDQAGTYGIVIYASTFAVSDCEVTNGADVGVFFATGSGLAISDCNIFGNAGNGVVGGSPVNAQGNWWGDAAGPTGPHGDGVGPNVDGSHYLTAPINLGPFPAPDLQPVARAMGSRSALAGSK